VGFRLVPKKFATLNDLEQCNGHYFAFAAEFGSFAVVEYKPILSAIKM